MLLGLPRWAALSEDGYEVTVLDTFGEQVWQDVNVPKVSGSSTRHATVLPMASGTRAA